MTRAEFNLKWGTKIKSGKRGFEIDISAILVFMDQQFDQYFLEDPLFEIEHIIIRPEKKKKQLR